MKLASLLTTASLLVGTAVSAMDYKEAPSLKEMVSKGEIPPIEQRLPKTPFVVEKGVISHADELPDWKPGNYGGTMRFGHNPLDSHLVVSFLAPHGAPLLYDSQHARGCIEVTESLSI